MKLFIIFSNSWNPIGKVCLISPIGLIVAIQLSAYQRHMAGFTRRTFGFQIHGFSLIRSTMKRYNPFHVYWSCHLWTIISPIIKRQCYRVQVKRVCCLINNASTMRNIYFIKCITLECVLSFGFQIALTKWLPIFVGLKYTPNWSVLSWKTHGTNRAFNYHQMARSDPGVLLFFTHEWSNAWSLWRMCEMNWLAARLAFPIFVKGFIRGYPLGIVLNHIPLPSASDCGIKKKVHPAPTHLLHALWAHGCKRKVP